MSSEIRPALGADRPAPARWRNGGRRSIGAQHSPCRVVELLALLFLLSVSLQAQAESLSPLFDKVAQTPLLESDSEEQSQPEISGIPISALSAIIGAETTTQLTDQLKAVIALAAKIKRPAKRIYLTDLMQCKKITQNFSLMMQMNKAGGRLHCPPQLPEQYKHIQRTPTWILETVQGEEVLEGEGRPQRFINSRGDYILSER